MNSGIFREYDLRGVYGQDFDLADAESIGRGVGSLIRRRGGSTAVVGRDCRLSSPDLGEAVIAGMATTGLTVYDLGVCPTPVLYFSLFHLDADGGLMITASHNPPEYNGFKVCVGRETIFGQDIQALRELIFASDFERGTGSRRSRDIVTPYSEHLSANLHLERPVRVAVDAGNGTGGVVAGPILERLGCQVTPLFFEMDGRFPNHHPDPTVPGNLATLSATVRREGLELGLGFDGDTDRLGLVDEEGRIIFSDLLLLILAREILSENPGAKIIADVKCSQLFFSDLTARGGRPIMWRSGHSLVKNKLKTEGGLLAGEMSGHIFFAHRYFGFDDAIYTAGRLLEIVARRPGPLSSFLADLPPMFATPEIRVDCPEEEKFRLVELVKADLAASYDTVGIDGVRVTFPDGWGLLRASNTGPIVVMRFEAQSPERLDEIRHLVEKAVARAKERL